MKITNYTILTNANPAQLSELVAMSINAGWQPLGGVAMGSERDSGLLYCQAMVKGEQMSVGVSGGGLISKPVTIQLEGALAGGNGGKRKKEGK